MEILTFDIQGHEYGMPLEPVREIVRAVEVIPLAGAPSVVEGVIDYRGDLVPIFSLRRRFGLPDAPVRASDVFIILDTGERLTGVHADGVRWLAEVEPERVRDAHRLVRGGAHVSGAVSLPDGVVLLYDVERFLSAAEEETLDRALAERGSRAEG